MNADTSAPPRRTIILLLLSEAAILALLVVAMMKFGLGWIGAILIGLVAVGFPLLFVRASERHARARGDLSPAMRRYNRRMILASFAYVAALFAAIWIDDYLDPSGLILWLVAFLPAAAVLLIVWAMVRLLAEEDDEYLRSRLVESTLTATAVVLVITTVWGFFEQFGLVPHVASWAVVPIFALGLGFAQCRRALRS